MPVTPSEPLVSVVVPAYNSCDTLGGTLTSVLTQTYPRVELIVVDDGSTDETPALLAAYGARLRHTRQENAGLSATRNAGARLATGDLVAFVDADDMLLPQYLERLVTLWQRAGGGRRAAASNAYFLRSEGISAFRTMAASHFPPQKDQRLAILQGNFLSAFMMFPTDVYLELGGCDETLRCAEDWDLWLRAIYADVEALFQPKPQALYRWRPGSLSAHADAMAQAEDRLLQRAQEEYGPGMDERCREFLTRRMRSGSPRVLQRQAEQALLRGEYGQARRLFGQASSMVPRDWKLRTRYATMTACPPAARLWRRRLDGAERSL